MPLLAPSYRHHWCVHASAFNGSARVRQAVIARFHCTLPGRPLLWDDGGVGSDGSLWKYWGDALREDGGRGGAASRRRRCHFGRT